MRLSENPSVRVAMDVLEERLRQKTEEGWTPEHDDEHELGEMALAASCYAEQSCCSYERVDPGVAARWPWSYDWWKPKNPRRDLVRAAALILAEIERLDRAPDRQSDDGH